MQKPPSTERQLFGTLLASRPARSRSWKALTIAVALHAMLLALALITFKPFQFDGAAIEDNPLNIIIVEEPITELPNPFARAAPPALAAAPASPRARDEGVILRGGPIQPIIINETATMEPSETVEPTGIAGGAAGGSLSSRLLPQYIDPRITNSAAFPEAPKTGVAAVRERIGDRLAIFNDSMAAEAEADRRATDWTVKGKNGERWGISPDGIHLGKVTLPPLAFTPPAGRRDEINGRVRDFNEIEAQAFREESRASFKERVQAIRERKDRERAEKKRATPKPVTE